MYSLVKFSPKLFSTPVLFQRNYLCPFCIIPATSSELKHAETPPRAQIYIDLHYICVCVCIADRHMRFLNHENKKSHRNKKLAPKLGAKSPWSIVLVDVAWGKLQYFLSQYLETVSYTHLDVYKRQVIFWIIAILIILY